jgi:hypothetical protein
MGMVNAYNSLRRQLFIYGKSKEDIALKSNGETGGGHAVSRKCIQPKARRQ